MEIIIPAMEAIIANASTLNQVLLDTDEEEYDATAVQTIQLLKKLNLTDPPRTLEVREYGQVGLHKY